MMQSHVVEVNGVFVGVAMRIDVGYRFLATDSRLLEWDFGVSPTLEEVRLRVRRALLAAVPAAVMSIAPRTTAAATPTKDH